MRHRQTVLLAAGLVALAGCSKSAPIPGETYEVPTGDWDGGEGGTARIPVSSCTSCHGTQGLDNTGADPLIAAAPPRSVDGSQTAPAVGAHRAHLQNRSSHDAFECASCHLVPTSFPHPEQRQGKITFSRLATASWTGPRVAPAWDATARTCASTYCHGNFPNGNASNVVSWTGSAGCGSCHGISPTNGPGGTHPTVGGQGCGACHGGYTNGSVDPALHVNGRVDGGAEPAGGAACAGCHGALFAGMNGASAVSKHALGADAGTNTSPTDSGIAWASPLSSNDASARSCVNMCHADHPHDLTSPVTATHEYNAYLDASTSATRDNGAAARIGSGTGANRARTDFDGSPANGGLCASCHRNPVQTGGPTVDKASFTGSAHDFTTNAAAGEWSYELHDGGLFLRNCTKCHASSAEGRTPQAAAGGPAVHFGDNASLLSGTTNPAGAAAGFVCYNCHGSGASPAAGAQGDRSGKDIQSQIAHATAAGQSGHPSDSDSVHDSAAEYVYAAYGNALGVPAGAGQRHASCLDCHDPHKAKAGTHATGTNVAGPPLDGAWGARLATNPAFWTAPASADFAKTTIAAGVDLEATLCFKCHSAYYWGTGTPPTSPGLAAAQTDTAREFNPNNVGSYAGSWASGETAGGFHPVLAAAGGNLGAVNLANLVTANIAWSTTSRNLMTCTDCHRSDATTDPNGPHGSAAKFVLRGPNTGWSSTTTTTTSGMPSGTFCANCHSATFASSRFTQHYSRSNHRVACMNCHAAIPHGGPRPGVLVAIGGACTGNQTPVQNCAVNVGGVIAGWDQTAPYAGLAAGNSSLYILSYPTSNATTWGQGNCGCGTSGGH